MTSISRLSNKTDASFLLSEEMNRNILNKKFDSRIIANHVRKLKQFEIALSTQLSKNMDDNYTINGLRVIFFTKR